MLHSEGFHKYNYITYIRNNILNPFCSCSPGKTMNNNVVGINISKHYYLLSVIIISMNTCEPHEKCKSSSGNNYWFPQKTSKEARTFGNELTKHRSHSGVQYGSKKK